MAVFVQRIADAFINFWASLKTEWPVYVLQLIAIFVLLYSVFKILKANKGGKLIAIYVVAIVVFGLAFSFSASLSSQMLFYVILVLSFLAVTMFTSEIKRTLLDAGAKKNSTHTDLTVSHIEKIIDETIRAVQHMSKNDIGALIVLSNGNLPEGIISSGTIVNADINAPMIEALFYPKAPLHDGAVIIEDDKIYAAGCFLPIIQDDTLPQEVGSRHRAALGVTAVASVTAIVVSEETGIISIIKNGTVVKRYASDADLKNALSSYYWSDLTAEKD